MEIGEESRVKTYLKNEYLSEIKHFKKVLCKTDSNYYWVIELIEDSSYYFKNYEYEHFIFEKTLDLAIEAFNKHISKR